MNKFISSSFLFPISAFVLSQSVEAHARPTAVVFAPVNTSNSCGFEPSTTFANDKTYSSEDDLDNQSRIVGGKVSATCAWPATAFIQTIVNGRQSACTATLVTPNVITYAAHCGRATAVNFGEQRSSFPKTVQVKRCKTHPRFNGNNLKAGVDVAYCELSQPVTDVPSRSDCFGM